MKNIPKQHITLFALLFCVANLCQAQDLIREIPQFKHDYSIIREYKYGQWLTYTFNTNYHTFIMASPTVTTVPAMTFEENIEIKDFEIFNDTVYFCGRKWSFGTDDRAIYGYFSLLTFPSSPVTYYECTEKPWLVEFTKLDIYSDGTFRHLVMVGPNKYEYGHITEVLISNLGVNSIYSVSPGDGNYVMDDIAVTNNRVVVISRYDSIGYGYVPELLYFTKLPTPGTFIITNNITQKTTPLESNKPLLIEYCDDDWFVVAGLPKLPSEVFISSFNYTTHFKTYIPPHLKKLDLQLIDLKYNHHSKSTDIIAFNNTDINNCSSIAYHYDLTLLSGATTIYEHFFDDIQLLSLDYLTTEPDFFIATGFNATTPGGAVDFYKYKFNQWFYCIPQNQVEVIEITSDQKEISIESATFQPNLSWKKIEPEEITIPITTICE